MCERLLPEHVRLESYSEGCVVLSASRSVADSTSLLSPLLPLLCCCLVLLRDLELKRRMEAEMQQKSELSLSASRLQSKKCHVTDSGEFTIGWMSGEIRTGLLDLPSSLSLLRVTLIVKHAIGAEPQG